MTTSGKSFFDQFLDDYFAEAEEHLTSARTSILSIETAGPNKEIDGNTLDELLRNFHSLKGLSAMVGLEEATQLAHHIEDYLKELKRPNTGISADGIERVVAGIAAIEQVLEAKRKSEEPPDTSVALLHLEAVAEELRTQPDSSIKRDVSTWRFLFKSSAELAKQGFTVNSVREELRKIGKVIKASPQVLSDGQLAFEFFVAAKVPESAFEKLRSYCVEYERIADETVASALPKSDGVVESSPSRVGPESIIRVEMTRLDDLMRVVGELVISRFRLDEGLRTASDGSSRWEGLEEINSSMERQLRELREGVMRIRMVPIGQVFERMRLVVRGLERELNKRVELRIEGHTTEIDKMVVEKMMDPLLHLVRNALSHGLESPKERATAGKPEKGVLRLSANAAGDTVILEAEDDGRGMDIEKITSRAKELGLIRDKEPLDSKRILDIISAPGFTTRDEADLASGRGIGMAAVRAAVGELGGSLTMTTRQGEGTRFTIRLPLTLMIADSLMITASNQRFAIPQTAVSEVLSVDSSAIKVLENNEVISFRGAVLPIVRLTRVFRLSAPKQERLHVLVIANGGSPTGLAVDRIDGQREIVVRTITDPLLRVPGIVGATELGDGRPVLILDPHSVIEAARDLRTSGSHHE
jgi:two-component system, chemotaxis family, sensor kinase CheA